MILYDWISDLTRPLEAKIHCCADGGANRLHRAVTSHLIEPNRWV
jgi:hypothetical protein